MSPPTEQRFRRLFAESYQQIYVYCRRRADEETARECAAETFLVAWRRIEAVPTGDRSLPWLYGVARRVLANRFRTQSRRRNLLSRLGGLAVQSPPEPEAVVIRRAEDQEVVDALSRLRPRDQELLRLAVWEELPHKEISDILGCSAHAIDQRIRRAGDRLRSELRRAGHRRGWTATPTRREET